MQESVTILNFKKWPKPRKMLAILLAAIFLFILIIILILIIAIYTSKIGIEVMNLRIDTQNGKKINDECKIYAFVLIFNKIKLFLF